MTFGRELDDDEYASPKLVDSICDAFEAAAPVFRLLSTLE